MNLHPCSGSLFQTAGDGGELPDVQRKDPEGEPSETDGPAKIHLYWGGSIRSTLIWASASHALHILEQVLDAVPHNLPHSLLPVLCVTGNKILMLLVVQWTYHITSLKWWTDFSKQIFIGLFIENMLWWMKTGSESEPFFISVHRFYQSNALHSLLFCSGCECHVIIDILQFISTICVLL